GQDLPVLLQFTPSVVTTSDAGAGVGYTGIRVRGTDATRVNVTLNGIPYNDPESQGTFWVNLPDFASSVESVQIQRGVGGSTNGAGAFGATVNVQTHRLRRDAYAEVGNTYGSFNTWKHTVRVGTGLLGDRWAFDGRLSRIQSDGFIDRARSDLRSFFTSGGYYGKRTQVRANVFSGREQTYQAWYGVPEAVAEGDAAGIEAFIALNFPSPGNAEYLRTGGRTLNWAGTDFFQQSPPYDNETDNYQQDHYQLFVTHTFSPAWSAEVAGFYTYGRGYFEQFVAAQNALGEGRRALYGLDPVIVNGDTLLRSNVVRRRWLSNDFLGTVFSVQYQGNGPALAFGGGWNQYDGHHYGELLRADFMPVGARGRRYYQGTGFKTDANVYAKANADLTERMNGYVDLQLRRIGYELDGTENDQRDVTQRFEWLFFNPKAGLNYQWGDQRLYASLGVAHREPTRANLVGAPDGQTPRHERLYNGELGYQRQTERTAGGLNLYLMSYRDQLVQTGELNDVGEPLAVNVDRSFRAGVELTGTWRPHPTLNWEANATVSVNRIRRFSERNAVLDDFFSFVRDTTFVFEDVPMAFAPTLIGASQLTWRPGGALQGAEAALLSKYVGEQYLDNTGNEGRKLDAYFVNDLRLSYTFSALGAKSVAANLLINNVLDARYSSNGYTYLTLFNRADRPGGIEIIDNNFVYPQAGINFLLGLTVGF
ncbi:MAG: TonB-dependent receptor plug domain-containing protein, partial [Catalinimonas sp.]